MPLALYVASLNDVIERMLDTASDKQPPDKKKKRRKKLKIERKLTLMVEYYFEHLAC